MGTVAQRGAAEPAGGAGGGTALAPRPARGPMTAEERRRFERDGYLVVPGVLGRAEVDGYAAAVDAAYAREVEAGHVGADGSFQRRGAVAGCPDLAPLVDHPAVLPLVWSVLGWNIQVVHSHYDVHPPLPRPQPFRWRWHQDGGRQNVDIETDPRPRLSLFATFWLSDVSEPGRGNLKVLPGSHVRNHLPGPPEPGTEWPDPDGAVEVRADPGDVVVFDRRVWHARTLNHSGITRRAVFLGYSYRWITIRDEVPAPHMFPLSTGLNPVRRQLLGDVPGAGDGDGRWGLRPDEVPLYADLRARGLLDPDLRSHRRLYP